MQPLHRLLCCSAPDKVFRHCRVASLNVVLVTLDPLFQRAGLRSLQQLLASKGALRRRLPYCGSLLGLSGLLLPVLLDDFRPLIFPPLGVVHHFSQPLLLVVNRCRRRIFPSAAAILFWFVLWFWRPHPSLRVMRAATRVSALASRSR